MFLSIIKLIHMTQSKADHKTLVHVQYMNFAWCQMLSCSLVPTIKTAKSAKNGSDCIYSEMSSIHIKKDATHNTNMKYKNETFLQNIWFCNEGIPFWDTGSWFTLLEEEVGNTWIINEEQWHPFWHRSWGHKQFWSSRNLSFRIQQFQQDKPYGQGMKLSQGTFFLEEPNSLITCNL
jgi:hypothetical protein